MNQIDVLRDRFSDKGLRDSLAKVLPRHVSLERLCMITLQAVTMQPKLLECSPNSIIRSLLQAAQIGLDIGGGLGHGYLVPYATKSGMVAQFIPGYRGLMELARRSGKVLDIEARIVRTGDKFDLSYGLQPELVHAPSEEGERTVRGAYAIATLIGGRKSFDYMPVAEIEKTRKRSKASHEGPWITDYEEMCKKTVVRRLVKYLPLSPELGQALEMENAAEGDGLTVAVLPELEDKPASLPVTGRLSLSSMKGGAVETHQSIQHEQPPVTEEQQGEKQRPTLDEVKARQEERKVEIIEELLLKLEYDEKTKASMKARYIGREDKLIADLQKAIKAKENRESYAKEVKV